MKVTKLEKGIYRVQGKKSTVVCSNIGFWIANLCEEYQDCTDSNSLGVAFDTFKQLKYWLSKFDNF